LQPPDVSVSEKKQIETKGFKDFLAPPNETGLLWIRRQKDGSCFFLRKNTCAVYDVRPAICRLEPFTIADYDFEHDKIVLELNFPSACGCQGVSERGAVPVEVIGKAAQAVVQKILMLTASDMGLAVSDRRVASEARARILRARVALADLSI
jgi:Fe-S-cluster containining protein